MKTCENCGHKKVCSFFNDWPNCPNWEPQLVHCGECKSWDEAVLASDIKNAPTVDAVEVVRCRECFYYTPVDKNTGKCAFLIGEYQYVVPDGYCDLGERKGGADNG